MKHGTTFYALRGYTGLWWTRDGNAIAVVRSDFVDLQESPSVWPECPKCTSLNLKPGPHFRCLDCGAEWVPDFSALEEK